MVSAWLYHSVTCFFSSAPLQRGLGFLVCKTGRLSQSHGNARVPPAKAQEPEGDCAAMPVGIPRSCWSHPLEFTQPFLLDVLLGCFQISSTVPSHAVCLFTALRSWGFLQDRH